jgi:hypothetical protein
MKQYFLCDPLMLLPPPGSSALKVLIEVPDYSRASRVIVRLTVLEAVSFKFGSDGYQACLDALQEVPAKQIPMEERTDVQEELRKEDWIATGGSRVWLINDADEHRRYFKDP